MWAGVAQGGNISFHPIQSVNDMLSPSRHAGDTTVIAVSRQAMLLVKYLETCFSDLEQWLREWSLAINVKKSFAVLFAKAGRRIAKPRLFGEPIQWVDTAHYPGVTIDTRLTWSTHNDQVRKKAAQGLGPLLNRRSGLSIRNSVLLNKQLVRPMMTMRAPSGGPPFNPISENHWCFSLGVFTLLPVHLGT